MAVSRAAQAGLPARGGAGGAALVLADAIGSKLAARIIVNIDMFTDWTAYFWTQIQNPATVLPEMFNIPWLFVALQPLRLIGQYPALILVQIVSIGVIYKLSRQLQLSNARMILTFLSAPVLWNFFMGQIDGLIIGAYLLPPTFAVLAALFKPQVCLSAGWQAIKEKPILIAIPAVLIVLAFLLWRWPLSVSDPQGLVSLKSAWLPPIVINGWNWSIWPWGLLLLPFLFLRDKQTGMLVTPFLFPYAGLQSLIGPILVIATKSPTWLFVLAWLILWLRWAWMLALI